MKQNTCSLVGCWWPLVLSSSHALLSTIQHEGRSFQCMRKHVLAGAFLLCIDAHSMLYKVRDLHVLCTSEVCGSWLLSK